MKTPAKEGYATDLSDGQWAYVQGRLPKGGRPPKYPRRAMLNAMLYLERTGCHWRLLPGPRAGATSAGRGGADRRPPRPPSWIVRA